MLGNRDEIRFANLALINGRQMSIRASTMSIFPVAMTKSRQISPYTCPSLPYVVYYICCAFSAVSPSPLLPAGF